MNGIYITFDNTVFYIAKNGEFMMFDKKRPYVIEKSHRIDTHKTKETK
jgi:hypothetical protein